MKLLYWTELFWPYIGGVEVLSLQLIKALLCRGHDVSVVTSHGSLELPNSDRHEGIDIYRFPILEALQRRNPTQILRIQKKIIELKQQIRADVVHVNLSDPGVFFHLQTEKAWPCPTLLSFQVSPGHLLAGQKSLVGKALQKAAWVTTPSQAVLNQLKKLGAPISKKSSVIPNATAITAIEPTPLPWSMPILLCVGRLVEDKGFEYAIRALSLLPEKLKGVRLVIAGDGPDKARLQSIIEQLGLADRIELPGWIKPELISKVINRATVIIIPSICFEAFGLVAAEAGLMKRPVIASNIGGIPEAVIHGQTGLLFYPGDVKQLASAIVKFLSNKRQANRMGKNAYGHAQKSFSMDRYCLDYESVYRRIIEENVGLV